MSSLIELGWWLWEPLCAWLVRVVVVRLLRPRLGDWAFVAAYAVWVVSFLAGMAYVAWSGMEMYGFDASDPWQLSGWVVLFLSPFGLPVLFGGPIIFIVDFVRFAIRTRQAAPGR